MKRAESEAEAKVSRDLSIECTELLARTVTLVKQACEPEFFLTWRRECANLMGEFVDIINRAAFDFPALKPSDEEWSQVCSAMNADGALPTTSGSEVEAQLRHVLTRVETRITDIQRVTPRMSGEQGELAESLANLAALLDAWMPQPAS